jgi:D-aminopeptidase
MSNGSGDFFIAFSTANLRPHEAKERVLAVEEVTNDALSPLFLAAVEAVEEAIYNSLLTAGTVRGRDGHLGEAIPVPALRDLLREHGRLR